MTLRSFRGAGMVLGGIDAHFAWQFSYLATSTLTLCGKRCTWWHWVGSGGALGRCEAASVVCGRYWRPLCVAGVAQGDAGLALVERLVAATRPFAWQALHLVAWTLTFGGRCGTSWQWRLLCVAGVALGDTRCSCHVLQCFTNTSTCSKILSDANGQWC